MLPVTYDDVLAAVPRVRKDLSPTPLLEWPGLSQLLGLRFFLKHENHQPVGAFKVRGGINLVSQLSATEQQAGLIGSSTGNHGQSLAFAARRHGVPCTIVVPARNNPDKVRAMRQWGATVIEHGPDFDAAREETERLAQAEGYRYVHSANEPLLIAGVGTMAHEIFETLPAPDVIFVPIGLGSGVCGTAIVAKHLRPTTKIIGVQAERAAAVANSWQAGTIQPASSAETWAEGMATRVPATMTFEIMRQLMDDVVLVSEEELRQAALEILRQTHNLAEGAGAATLAAAWKLRDQLAQQTVVGILSGGNLDLRELPAILASGGLGSLGQASERQTWCAPHPLGEGRGEGPPTG